ncbi:DUF397 domain-containing protein [Streptomyces sp. SBST2-5]|uniref:DUF397 domain-containing protein n=1 Tax=Streptomyces composti TaxID=2720025 RepID=A0ABX1AE34_9ACTN|nr:DUF397 domain-containing protein [Streptomyces composti]
MASNRIDLSEALWSKSSHSNGDGGDCVEIASDFPGAASGASRATATETGVTASRWPTESPVSSPCGIPRSPTGPC